MEALFQGLQMFQQGLQQYSTSRAISQATEAVNQLNQSEISDQQKRVAQMQLGNQLAAHLSQLGATGAQIQGATSAIKPQQYGSAQEMFLEGKLTGNEDLVKQAEQLQQWAAAPALAAEERQFKRQLDLQDRKFNQELQLKAFEAGVKDKGGLVPYFEQVTPGIKMDATEVRNMRQGLSTFEKFSRSLSELEKMVDDVGTESFSAFSSKSGQMGTRYRKLLMDLKGEDMLKLGVLQNLDLEQMKELFPDPTSAVMSGSEWKNRVKTFKEMMVSDIQSKANSVGGKFNNKLFEDVGFVEKIPEGAGLRAGERVVQRPDPKNPGKTVPVVYNSMGDPVRLYTGGE